MKVYKTINQVQAALAKIGISKNQKNQQQGYKFRGIDDIYGALAPLLAEHGLCILPSVLERSVTTKETKSGGNMFYVVVHMQFAFVCAEDSSSHIVSTYGEAMDSGDKATNKAMSAAFKYACLQAFCIPTEGDNDADLHTHEIITPKRGGPTIQKLKEPEVMLLSVQDLSLLENKINAARANAGNICERLNISTLSEMPKSMLPKVIDKLDKQIANLVAKEIVDSGENEPFVDMSHMAEEPSDTIVADFLVMN